MNTTSNNKTVVLGLVRVPGMFPFASLAATLQIR